MIAASVISYVKFLGDQDSESIYSTGSLDDSPASQELVTLLNGDNTISPPSIIDFVVHGVVIVPPAGNLIEPILKGAVADTGISLSASQASVIHFGATVPASIVFEVAADIVGLRLVWF